ncbi:hypothetical protein [Mycobacterium sp.]|uniref:hypothetical protein n=1 Tax=Mycobacterium sp. TaxID=1785 RepID=UPI003C75B3E9
MMAKNGPACLGRVEYDGNRIQRVTGKTRRIRYLIAAQHISAISDRSIANNLALRIGPATAMSSGAAPAMSTTKRRAQAVADREQITVTAQRGWTVFHKHDDICRDEVERHTVISTGARLFCVPRAM